MNDLPTTLASWASAMADERWHGEDDLGDFVDIDPAPTFALLFDREEACKTCPTVIEPGYGQVLRSGCVYCDGNGKRTIPGHLSQLADWLASQGDTKRAEAVRAMRVSDQAATYRIGPYGKWCVLPIDDMDSWHSYRDYADAAREVLRRVAAILGEAK